MNFLQFAITDWGVYQDPSRIAVYVEKGKITESDYQDITGEEYFDETN